MTVGQKTTESEVVIKVEKPDWTTETEMFDKR